MKNSIILLLLMLSFSAAAAGLECKQKIMPVKIEYEIQGGQAMIKITSEQDIKNFKVKNIHGIDGLAISNTEKPTILDLEKNQSVNLLVNFTKPEGLAYIVAQIEGEVDSGIKWQILTIPVGKLTKEQIKIRKGNIKTFDTTLKKSSKSLLNEKMEKKFHIMRLDPSNKE